MQDWLTAGMESLTTLPGRVVDIHDTPATILTRPDIALCLAGGVAVAMGTTPIGFIPGKRLARMIADATTKAEREVRTAREQVKRLRRDRRMLAAGLGHELRTPVSAICGYSELVALGLENGRTVSAADHNKVIWEAAQSLLGTIDSMLDVARIEADAAHLDETEFALPELAEIVVCMMATLAAARNVTLQLELAAELPPVFADQRMFRQILVNLVANAIKYGGVDGTVTIAAHVDRRERMVIEVRDRGAGMSAAAIETAMQPFRRGEDDRAILPGSGLGLPLVKALAELHDTAFQLLSVRGKGTFARLTVPSGRVRIPRVGRQEAFAFQRATELFG